jgi:hypothetical protein
MVWPWLTFQFLDPILSRKGYLDGGSALRKACIKCLECCIKVRSLIVVILLSCRHGLPKSKSKLRLSYDRWSVGQFVLKSGTHPGPATNFPPSLFNYMYTIAGLLTWGALSDERTGL